jgi:hypothetical protein
MAFFLLLINSLRAQNDFSKLTNSVDSSYGYTAQNPVKLKKGDQVKSIKNSYHYLSGLKTQDSQSLNLLYRSSLQNPNFKEPAIRLTYRYSGMPVGNLGILDRYVFLTSNTKDTIVIYIDIYGKGELKLPVGLKYYSGK